jgi:hypothetical protein
VRLGSWPSCIELAAAAAAVVATVAAALVDADLDVGADADVAPACGVAVGEADAVWAAPHRQAPPDVNSRIAYRHSPNAALPPPNP